MKESFMEAAAEKRLRAAYLTHRASDAEILQEEAVAFLEVVHSGFAQGFDKACAPDLAFLDVDIPHTYFPDNIRRLRDCWPGIPVFVLTRETDFFFQLPPLESPPDAVLPFPPEGFYIEERIMRCLSDSPKLDRACEAPPSLGPYPDGISAAAVRLRKEIAMAADADDPVLLLGETGCGKERAAAAVHFHSARKKGPFRAQNIAAIPSTLIDSILFGAEKGSYTGASGSSGLFEQSKGGTLFLDEIGEMDMELQPKLLRALEEGEIYRVGGKSAVKTDFRLICATNRDLKSRVSENKFRSDLYYRLDIIRIEIPPLRSRLEDIPCLIEDIMRSRGKSLSLSALDKMSQYSWPGNVRQLLNCIARAAARTKARKIAADDIVF